ncbi:chondroitinase family polysaccharide lyase [Paenibacillus oryzisoli]|uniref:chondroitinase family polysaccharide lyase n=1 Tax=Paenibacillus oryzisoli TaxID=1850517 RepID=UPI003D2AB00F
MTIYSFESGIPESISCDASSRLTISDRHYKDGKHSLQWDYAGAGRLTISGDIGYRPFQEGASSQARDSFAVWIYNLAPIEGQLTFEFSRGGQETDCSFNFGLQFQGWRTAWVAYERDMTGVPHPDMDTITLRMPEGVKAGTIFIDQLMVNTKIDPRFHTRDAQVPFVNLAADASANAHWLALYAFEQLRSSSIQLAGAQPEQHQSSIVLPTSSTREQHHSSSAPQKGAQPNQTITAFASPTAITPEQEHAHSIMNARYEALFYTPRTCSQEEVDQLKRQFSSFGITQSQVGITGRPVELPFRDHFPLERKEELKQLAYAIQLSEITKFLLAAATCFRSSKDATQKAELEAMLILVLDHLEDQGWTYGSSQGTVHHFGYNFRDYYPAVFLIRDVLQQSGRLARTQRTMRWFSGAGRIHTPLAEVEGNIDIYNTTLHGMLASILIGEDAAEKAWELVAFRDWLSQSMLPAKGLRAAYKIDGSAYHHVNHYPAYAVGGFQGVTPMMYVLSGTPYRIHEQAHATIRKALLAMRLYSNKREWLLSLSARHPTGRWALDPEPFAWLARCGTPDGNNELDVEVAAAYLRLLEPTESTEAVRLFQANQLTPEPAPTGHWTMNYAALAIHRRGEWLAGMRGHSRYLWANETYVSANLYGRYISHGHLQIMSKGEPIANEASGYHHDGWDWNRWPGTTTIHKPIAELRSDVRNVDTLSGFEEMLLSDETYAGGLHFKQENGMFAMKLHEHPKYEGSHRARKSAFFFDHLIVCLGTDIENDNEEQPTETTLFQQHLPHPHDAVWLNDTEPVQTFPYFQKKQLDKAIWIVDNKGNGYYVPGGQALGLSKSMQHSKHQATDADTQGDFAAAWLEHGTSPQGGRYEYAILVNTTAGETEAFCARMQSPGTAAYTVLRQDRSAHVVTDTASGITAYALFETDDSVNTGRVSAVDTPCMVMMREEAGGLTISVVDPDLRLYEGVEADQYDENGIQKEVSVYSRDWVHAESIPHTLRLTLQGLWAEQEALTDIRVQRTDNGFTVIEVTCKDAMPREFTLQALS